MLMKIMVIKNGLWDKKIKGDKTSAGTAIVQFKPHSESPFESYFITVFQKVKRVLKKTVFLSGSSDKKFPAARFPEKGWRAFFA